MTNNKILSMISLATKAGKTVSGELTVEKTVKAGKAYLVIMAENASDHTKKKFSNMCTFYEIPIFEFGTKEELGHYIGKEFRATLAVTDEGFSNTIKERLKNNV